MSPTVPVAFFHKHARELLSKGPNSVYDRRSAIDSWIIPTFWHLNKSLDIDLTSEIPKSGILFISSYDLAFFGNTIPESLFVVQILADGFPQKRADLTIVQNWEQAPFCEPAFVMPHWPEPELIARNMNRGNQISNIAYIGATRNLDRQFTDGEFEKKLKDLAGIKFSLPSPEKWKDFSSIDLVIAIRPIVGPAGSAWAGGKPATKLFNAALAGVPAIVGPESAYFQWGSCGSDFLVATDSKSALNHINRLFSNPQIYAKMRSNLASSASGFSRDAISLRWEALLYNVIMPAALNEIKLVKKNMIINKLRSVAYRCKRKGLL